MTDKRLRKIFEKVVHKVIDDNPHMEHSYELIQLIYKTVGLVIKELHKTEHFLNAYIDHEKRFIIIRDEETLRYLGVLPYLDSRLVESRETYLVYFVTRKPKRTESLVGAVYFEDRYEIDIDSKEIGIAPTLTAKTIIGMYHKATNNFYTHRRERE